MAGICSPFAKLAVRLRPRRWHVRLFRRSGHPVAHHIHHVPHAAIRLPAPEACTASGSPSHALRAGGASTAAAARDTGSGLVAKAASALTGVGVAGAVGYAVLTSATASLLPASFASWTAPALPAETSPRLSPLAISRPPTLSVPEPSSLTILSVGLVGLGVLARRRH